MGNSSGAWHVKSHYHTDPYLYPTLPGLNAPICDAVETAASSGTQHLPFPLSDRAKGDARLGGQLAGTRRWALAQSPW